MFNFSHLFGTAETMMAEMGLASALGGSAAVYLFTNITDLRSLAMLTMINAAPHFLARESGMISGPMFEAIGLVTPFIALQLFGGLTLETALIWTAGATVGGLAGAAVAQSKLLGSN